MKPIASPKRYTLLIMNYRLFLIAALLAIMPDALRAQSALEADAAAFRYDSAHAQVEIDYGVLERGLAFKHNNDVWTAYASAKAEIWQNGRVAQEKNILDTVRCPCTQAQLDSVGVNKLLGVTEFAVPYGDTTTAAFLWQTGVKDDHSVFDTIVIPLILPNRDTSKFSFGGVEIATQVEKSSGQPSPFEKAGYIVTPNPSAIFG